MFAGPAIGGVILAFSGPSLVFALAACVVSRGPRVCVLGLKRDAPPERVSEAGDPRCAPGGVPRDREDRHLQRRRRAYRRADVRRGRTRGADRRRRDPRTRTRATPAWAGSTPPWCRRPARRARRGRRSPRASGWPATSPRRRPGSVCIALVAARQSNTTRLALVLFAVDGHRQHARRRHRHDAAAARAPPTTSSAASSACSQSLMLAAIAIGSLIDAASHPPRSAARRRFVVDRRRCFPLSRS